MTRIGRYDIVRRTGQTPLGTIYEAVDRETRRTVALQAAAETCSESLGRLNHPNIRSLIAIEQADGRIFLVLEHLDALPLLEWAAVRQAGPAELVKLLKAAASALDYAESNAVCHPGLTPRHLLVNSNALLKVAGFELPGVDALTCPSSSDAEREELEQSIPYRAPEFLAGDRDTSRAGQFSLAAIAFEALSGKRAFESPSPFTAMAAILRGKAADLALIESKFPPGVRRVLDRMLAADPALRYGSCTLAIEALEANLLRQPASPTRVTDAPAPDPVAPVIVQRVVGEGQRNRKRLHLIIAAVVVTALAMMALIVSQLVHPKAVVPPHETGAASAPAAAPAVPPASTPAPGSALGNPTVRTPQQPTGNQASPGPKPTRRKTSPKATKDYPMLEPSLDRPSVDK